MKKMKLFISALVLAGTAALTVYPVLRSKAAYSAYKYTSNITGYSVYLPQPKSPSCPLSNDFVFVGIVSVEARPMCFAIVDP